MCIYSPNVDKLVIVPMMIVETMNKIKDYKSAGDGHKKNIENNRK